MSELLLSIMPLPVIGIVGCCVPILPGSHGEARGPIEERTEFCAVDANWMVGSCPVCDVHLAYLCAEVGVDWYGVLEEACRDRESAERLWSVRERHSQEDTIEQRSRFLGDAPPTQEGMTDE